MSPRRCSRSRTSRTACSRAISRTGLSSLEARESPYRTHRPLDPRRIRSIRRLVHDGDARRAPPGSAAAARRRGPAAPREPQGARRRRGERRSEEHTSELQSQFHRVCRLLLEKKKKNTIKHFQLKKQKKNK